MKKSILLAILGIGAVGMTAAHAQGTVNFFNYFGSTSPRISTAGNDATALGSEWTAELYWAAGVQSSFSSLSAASSSLCNFGLAPNSFPAADGQIAYGAGWFLGPAGAVVLPGTSAGQTITASVQVANGAITADSPLFQLTLGGGAVAPASLAGTAGASFVASVPEPTTMALGGLGLAALMLFRRKQV